MAVSHSIAVPGVKGFVSTATWTDRYWRNVERAPGDACWTWIGSKGNHGRASFWLDGRRVSAARVAWALHHGEPFPADKDACHTCDNPACVNPAHIWPGTARENALDAVRKGRLVTPSVRGLRPWNASITHCKSGHALDAGNVYVSPKGWRFCQQCRRDSRRKFRERARAGPCRPLGRAEGGVDGNL
jgi:hypothetical protein